MHEVCIAIATNVADCNHFNKPDPAVDAGFMGFSSYYQSLLRLHKRNTQYPFESEEEIWDSMIDPCKTWYACYNLEWEHVYYGASQFGNGNSWICTPGWEVSLAERSPLAILTMAIADI